MSAASGSMEPVVRAGRTPGSRAAHLVGRTDQRARLRGVLDEVIADGSRFVLLGGDAGAGKTTVIDAFTADLFSALDDRKAQLVRCQCVPLGGDGLPYAHIVGSLRELVAQHGREQVLEWAGAAAPALGVLLPDLTGRPPEGDSIRLQLFEAVTRLWEQASEHAPLVVVLEDIHWADESTRHLLRFGARALTDAQVMILASYRTDELTRRHPLRPFLAEIGRLPGAVRIDVPSLSRAEVAELLTRLLERPPTNAVIDTVYRRSEGIPYFVEELTRSAARGCIDMPDTLRDALNVRVQNLSAGAQQVVELAAVAGNHVEHALLAAAAGGATVDLDSGLREAIDAAVLTADESGLRLPTRVAPRGGARRSAAWPARAAARPVRGPVGGTSRACRSGHRTPGDRPSLVGGARGDQGVRLVHHGGPVRRGGVPRGAEDVRAGPGAVGPGRRSGGHRRFPCVGAQAGGERGEQRRRGGTGARPGERGPG